MLVSQRGLATGAVETEHGGADRRRAECLSSLGGLERPEDASGAQRRMADKVLNTNVVIDARDEVTGMLSMDIGADLPCGTAYPSSALRRIIGES